MPHKNREKKKQTDRNRYKRMRESRPFYHALKEAKRRCYKLGLEFSLTEENLYLPLYCPILGIPLTYTYKGKSGPTDNSPTMDRIDNNKGYTPDNVEVISWRANRLKSDGNINEFKQILAYMEKHDQHVPS
jgi:hypothetical protein